MDSNKKDFIDHVKERCIEATNMTEAAAKEFAMTCWKLGFTDSAATEFLIDENFKLYTRTKIQEAAIKELEAENSKQTETIENLIEREKTLLVGVDLYENALEKACEYLDEKYNGFTKKNRNTKYIWKQGFINEVVEEGKEEPHTSSSKEKELERALDRACNRLEELDQILNEYEHEETWTAKEWKEWSMKNE